MTDKRESQTKKSTGKEVTQPQAGQFLSPLDELEQWFDEVRRNWMQPFFFGRGWPERESVFGGRVPRVDVIDREPELLVRAELPGVSKENLDVSLQDNTLSIRATTRREEEEEKGQFYRRELSRGEFQRTIRLPCPVEGDKVKANFKDGVLELTIPKVATSKRKSIKVE
ncbi:MULTISPECIES: Hsp20/alpha crystallin family protein [Methylocaldum]|jgi:HSP20 family protein|uniref:Hsp20/alpha crystallin family protein n=1 Tax=unclassified Methylocaldum TaxID=2622260 RepID=UPI000A3220F0|nr:Hsp20/alpha crystallin family protein [Methylocaldum sp. RMAD-M]MBP1150657.1 HSP20 family protein [Methylocaldum sp. RMAD-M]MVF22357.1 Hsp20/alpha crystallin family protein [Methylocaldum sp. BRCS4]